MLPLLSSFTLQTGSCRLLTSRHVGALVIEGRRGFLPPLDHDDEFREEFVCRPRTMPGFVDQCCVGDVEGLLGFEVTLGRVRAASWVDLLACGSDGLSIS